MTENKSFFKAIFQFKEILQVLVISRTEWIGTFQPEVGSSVKILSCFTFFFYFRCSIAIGMYNTIYIYTVQSTLGVCVTLNNVLEFEQLHTDSMSQKCTNCIIFYYSTLLLLLSC